MNLSDLYTQDMIELMELHELYNKHEYKHAGLSVVGTDVLACSCGLYACREEYTSDKNVYPLWGYAAHTPHYWMPMHHMDKCRYEAYRQLAVWTNEHLKKDVEKHGVFHAIIKALKMDTGITDAQPENL